MSCTTELTNIGFDESCKQGRPIGIAFTELDPSKTNAQIALQATWSTLLKQDENRVHVFPLSDIPEITSDEFSTQTVAGGRDIDISLQAGEWLTKAVLMPDYVMRKMSQNWNGRTIYFCILYSENFIVGNTDSTNTNFEWREGTTSFLSFPSQETAIHYGQLKVTSTDAKGDQDNVKFVKAENSFRLKRHVVNKTMRDGAILEVTGSTTSDLKIQLIDAATLAGVSIGSADLTNLATDLLVTDSGAGAEVINAVTAIAGTVGGLNLNFAAPLAADTYTIIMKSAGTRASTTFDTYDFAVTGVDITVA